MFDPWHLPAKGSGAALPSNGSCKRQPKCASSALGNFWVAANFSKELGRFGQSETVTRRAGRAGGCGLPRSATPQAVVDGENPLLLPQRFPSVPTARGHLPAGDEPVFQPLTPALGVLKTLPPVPSPSGHRLPLRFSKKLLYTLTHPHRIQQNPPEIISAGSTTRWK